LTEGPDHFSVFGLERKLLLDLKALEAEFLRLSREHHPDRFATAEESERQEIQRKSARVNDAYRVLKDPVLRAEHLLTLEGVARPEGEAKCPPDLLAEVFELREALADGAEPGIAARVRGTAEEAERALTAAFERLDAAAADERPKRLAEVRASLDRRKFLSNLVREVHSTLG